MSENTFVLDNGQYEVIVEFSSENLTAVADDDLIASLLKGKGLKSPIMVSGAFAENKPGSDNLLIRRFALANKDDFEIFSTQMKTIKDVYAFTKGRGWD